MRVIREPHIGERHVGLALHDRIDGDEVILSGILQAAARKIDEDDGVRSGLLRLGDEVAQSVAQRLLIEIGGSGHVESGFPQDLRDETGVVDRGSKRRFL